MLYNGHFAFARHRRRLHNDQGLLIDIGQTQAKLQTERSLREEDIGFLMMRSAAFMAGASLPCSISGTVERTGAPSTGSISAVVLRPESNRSIRNASTKRRTRSAGTESPTARAFGGELGNVVISGLEIVRASLIGQQPRQHRGRVLEIVLAIVQHHDHSRRVERRHLHDDDYYDHRLNRSMICVHIEPHKVLAVEIGDSSSLIMRLGMEDKPARAVFAQRGSGPGAFAAASVKLCH